VRYIVIDGKKLLKPVSGVAGRDIWYTTAYDLYCLVCRKLLHFQNHGQGSRGRFLQAHHAHHEEKRKGKKKCRKTTFYW